MYGFSRRLSVRGFDARILLPDSGQEKIAEAKLRAAVAFLEQIAPYRLARLRELLPRLFVAPLGSNVGSCVATRRMCALKDEWVLESTTDAGQVALTLVHEGTHARISAAGIPYTGTNRARIERLCLLAELIVARRSPGNSHLMQFCASMLAKPDEFFSFKAHRERELETLRQLGPLGRFGAWIGQTLVLLTRSRTKRAT